MGVEGVQMLVSGGAREREFMHCYAPNFEELEEANWFGPVSLSVHPSIPPKKFLFFLDLESL